MKLLLDTHALIWLVEDDSRLGHKTRETIFDPGNDVFVSVVSFWEMAIKIRIGKLVRPDLEKLMATLVNEGLTILPLETRHIAELLRLPIYPHHRDPFDHQLIAQAICDELFFVSEDSNTPHYAVKQIACSSGLVTAPVI